MTVQPFHCTCAHPPNYLSTQFFKSENVICICLKQSNCPCHLPHLQCLLPAILPRCVPWAVPLSKELSPCIYISRLSTWTVDVLLRQRRIWLFSHCLHRSCPIFSTFVPLSVAFSEYIHTSTLALSICRDLLPSSPTTGDEPLLPLPFPWPPLSTMSVITLTFCSVTIWSFLCCV